MKNEPIGSERSWGADLATFDAALRARGMAEKTRRAYGVDLQQLADWAGRQGIGPREIDPRILRRFAGVLSERDRRPRHRAGRAWGSVKLRLAPYAPAALKRWARRRRASRG